MKKESATPVRGIRKQRIWSVVLGNLFLVAFVLAIVCGGVYVCGLSLLCSRLNSAADSMAVYNGLVTNSFLDTETRAARYADIVADRCFDAEAGTDAHEELRTLQTLQNDNDVGMIAAEGTVVSAVGALSPDAATPLIGTEGCVSLSAEGGAHALAFTAPIKRGDETLGTLYILDRNGLAVGLSTLSIYPEVQSYLILDENDRVVSYIGDAPHGSFDYASVRASGAHFVGEITKFDAARMIESGMIRTEVNAPPRDDTQNTMQTLHALATSYLSFDAWYEDTLPLNGWRTLAMVRQRYDAFSLRDLFLILLFGLFVACLPIVFSFSTTISHVVNNRKLARALLFDPVTGGNNFTYFKAQAAKVIRMRRYAGQVFVLAAIDMDRYRVYSDVHGHAQGEMLLYNIYQYISKHLRRNEVFTRYSVDQFALLMILSPEEEPLTRMELLMRGVSRLSKNDKVTCSAGLYVVNDRTQDVERMYHYASVAKDAARRGVSGRILRFDNAMRETLLGEQRIESLMDKALKNHEFAVYLQPKYSVRGHVLSGAEALIRWNSPELGFLSPGTFIPLFERNGFILRLDDFMLGEVCTIQRRWMDAGRALVPISVNISRAHFAAPDVAEQIRAIVDSHGVPYDMVELELTESAFFDDKETLTKTVDLLRGYGFPVSMDDFGSGFSSLNSLKDLPLDVVKLDREFFDATADAERGVTLIRDTIALAKHLRMEVVAEGIETREQVEFLMETGCDLIQGFYFAKPMPVSDFESLPRQFQ